MRAFQEYLENLRETVKREPKDDTERGFQTAVALIYENYKLRKIPNINTAKLKEMEEDIKNGRFNEVIKNLPDNK